PLDVAIFGEMLHPGLGLGAVAGANVDDVVEILFPQESRPGEGTDERNVLVSRDWLGHQRCRRADRADQREHLVLMQQLDRLQDRAIWVVAIVAADQLQRAAM